VPHWGEEGGRWRTGHTKVIRFGGYQRGVAGRRSPGVPSHHRSRGKSKEGVPEGAARSLAGLGGFISVALKLPPFSSLKVDENLVGKRPGGSSRWKGAWVRGRTKEKGRVTGLAVISIRSK